MNYGIRDYLYSLEGGCPEDNCPDCGRFECVCEDDEALTENDETINEALAPRELAA